MWNSGKKQGRMSWNSFVEGKTMGLSRIGTIVVWQFETKFRCVNITPFGKPVVPDEYGSNERSLGLTFLFSSELSDRFKPGMCDKNIWSFNVNVWIIWFQIFNLFYSPSVLISSLNKIVSLGVELFRSHCRVITFISDCWAKAQAFLITSTFSAKQIIAFGWQLNIWREISSLVYDGLTVVMTKPASADPKNAIAYSKNKISR